MKALIILLLLLSACSTVSYERSQGGEIVEAYKMTTWFKRVEDLSVVRTPGIFGLQIGSTDGDSDAITSVAKIMEFYANPIGTN